MSGGNLIVAIASAAIALSCVYLIWSRDYEDGLVGRIALGVLSLSTVVMFFDAFYDRVELLPASQVIIVGMALFLLRHVWRFCRWRKTGSHSWRVANK